MKYFLLSFIIAISFQTNAQTLDSKNKAFHFSGGYFNSLLKDTHFSPLSYSGGSFILGLGYQKEGERFTYYSNLDIAIANIKSPAADYLHVTRINVHLELGALKRLKSKSDKLNMAIGGQLHSYVDVLNFSDYSSISFFNIHSLDLSYRLSYQANEKHQFMAQLNLPLVGILVRPPFSGWDNYIYTTNIAKILYKGDLASFKNYQSVNLKTSYLLALNQKWDMIVNYNLRYNNTTVQDKATNLNNEFLVGLNLKF